MQLESISCQQNNVKAIELDKKYCGACFKSVNIYEIIMHNSSIVKGYSDFTTVGFKAISTMENDIKGRVIYIKKKYFLCFIFRFR